MQDSDNQTILQPMTGIDIHLSAGGGVAIGANIGYPCLISSNYAQILYTKSVLLDQRKQCLCKIYTICFLTCC